MRTILSIMLLFFGLMAYAVDKNYSDSPQLIDMELVDMTVIHSELAVSLTDVVVTNNSESNSDNLDNLYAIILPSPQRVEALPGYKRTLKSDYRNELTKLYNDTVFVPHRLGRTIYEAHA